jgi:hypothetical protein
MESMREIMPLMILATTYLSTGEGQLAAIAVVFILRRGFKTNE